MKKNLKLATIITVIVNAIGATINLICAYSMGRLPFGIQMAGGDCIVHTGFGVELLKIFVMTNGGGPDDGTYNKISFDLKSLVMSLVAVFIISMIVITIVRKIKNKEGK